MTKADTDRSNVPATPPTAGVAPDRVVDRGRPDDELIESELLVEDVSIDGMCGVY